jgi:hypothetical protein
MKSRFGDELLHSAKPYVCEVLDLPSRTGAVERWSSVAFVAHECTLYERLAVRRPT